MIRFVGILLAGLAVAGLAALLALDHNPKLAEELDLNSESRVLLIGTEGSTDDAIYRNIVGRSAQEVLQ